MTERESGGAVAEARPAATVLLVRDGAEGLEVFMVARTIKVEFAGGALVFPGGKVDPGDRDVDPAMLDDAGRAQSPYLRAFQVAAIREAFEEAGVLLAAEAGGAVPVPGDRAAALERQYARALDADALTIGEFCARENLTLLCGGMVHFAHWITPESEPRRYDTHFFVAAAPADHVAAHDGSETVDSLWIRPQDALADAEAERRRIVFPTQMNLRLLGRSKTVAEALEAARARRVVTVQPTMREVEGGRILRIPEEAGYGFSEILFKGPRSSPPPAG